MFFGILFYFFLCSASPNVSAAVRTRRKALPAYYSHQSTNQSMPSSTPTNQLVQAPDPIPDWEKEYQDDLIKSGDLIELECRKLACRHIVLQIFGRFVYQRFLPFMRL